MKVNEGSVDRIVRILLGLIALTVAYLQFGILDGNLLGIVIGALGGVFLLTGLVGFCPCYVICGMNTCSKDGCKTE